MSNLNIRQLAEELTSVQFEQLLRFRLQLEWSKMAVKPGMAMLVISTPYGKDEYINCSWTIGHSGKNQTSGELFDQACTEYVRRVEFEQTCKLKLIEGPAADNE